MKFTSMSQIVNSGVLKRFMDPRLIQALGHPFREHVLAECNEGIVSATQIGKRIGADVTLFHKHIRKLELLGCIEEVDARQRRGGKEHFFRAKSTVFFDNAHWAMTPRSFKNDFWLSNIQSTFEEAVGAAKAGFLSTQGDEHTSWIPGRFDSQGWSEAAQVLDTALMQIGAIQQRSAERLAERNERGTPATVALFGFKTGTTDPADRVS